MSASGAALRLAAGHRPGDGDLAERLRGVLRPAFLAESGWDGEALVLAPPRDHPLLGLRECAVSRCRAGVASQYADLCRVCTVRFKASGLTLAQFTTSAPRRPFNGERLCGVAGCQRPWTCLDMCQGHYWSYRYWSRRAGVTPAEYIASTRARPLPSLGPCQVPGCPRRADSRRGLCTRHRQGWNAARRCDPGADFAGWLQVASPLSGDHYVAFGGLPEQARLELLAAVQARTDAGRRTSPPALQAVVVTLRRARAASLSDLDEAVLASAGKVAAGLVGGLRVGLASILASPETERARDIWDLAAFGLTGRLDFTSVSQPWLREALKWWAEEDLPRHRGAQAARSVRIMITAVAEMSATWQLARADEGRQPGMLSRRDVTEVVTRLAHRKRTGQISEHARLRSCRNLQRFLADIRALGLTRPGGPAAGLPDDVRLARQDIPPDLPTGGPGRDLPPWVLKIITGNLHVLETRSGPGVRRLTEILIDTGRRPDEICQLPWNCLARGADAKPVLIYDDSKNYKPGRRLPVAEATATVIAAQQQHVRQRFPATAPADLVLFPRERYNPRGTTPVSVQMLGKLHREFITAIAGLLTTTVTGPGGQQRQEAFDARAVIPYAYRHSYAQRHADQGVPADVLRDLMGHDAIQSTLGYYRITEKRVRAAVDRVSAHQFDGQGRRVFRQIGGLLADEHARMRVGQVAVPFGICTEPSNVKAGGHACPYKYTCLGCGHFRSDPSYLPELKSYLQQLLADQERLNAATDIQDWARAQLAPRGEEITQLRELIRRIEADLSSMSAADQQRISDAVTMIRNTRQTVSLGMPAIRPPSPPAQAR